MNFRLSDTESALRIEIAEFARKHLPNGWVGPNMLDSYECCDFDFEMSIAKKLAEKGWLIMNWPEEYGGWGASLWEQTTYEIEVAYWRIPGSMMGIGGVQWVGPCLILFGTEEQKQLYLPMIASGEKDGVWCVGYSEPDAGSDFANIRTRAVRNGDHYIINGQKVWTSSAHRARWCWLAARTNFNSPKKHQGISLFIVDMKSPGITIAPLLNYYGRHHFNEVFFDNVKVPASNLVGEVDKGWYLLMQALSLERRSGAPMEYGASKRFLEELVQYVIDTKYEGSPLSQNPLVRQKLTDVAIELEVLKIFAYQMTWKMSKGAIPSYEASRNKVASDEVMSKMAIAGAEILGVYSQIDPKSLKARLGGLMQSTYLGFPGHLIAGGTAEIEKSIIAQFGLGLPKSY